MSVPCAPAWTVILVDTPVWIDWLRRGTRPGSRVLERLLDVQDIALAAVILQELLQGARGVSELARLRNSFAGLPLLVPDANTYADAGALYARCRWAGTTPRSPHDCLIAQTAIEHGLPLLHDDADFERIAAVEPRLRLLAT